MRARSDALRKRVRLDGRKRKVMDMKAINRVVFAALGFLCLAFAACTKVETDSYSDKEWDAFISNQVSCDVDLWLPKFETKFHIDLNGILSAMGMPSAFDAIKANFKAMSGSALCLSFVQQDAVIKVDEEGTEAAVVSSAGMLATSAGPGDHIVFHADHPFLYLITESSTGAVLFAGKYSGK